MTARWAAMLACLAIAAGRATGAISADQEAALTAALLEVPGRAAEAPAPEKTRGASMPAAASEAFRNTKEFASSQL